MDNNTFQTLYTDTLQAIASKRLLDALHSLGGLVTDGGARTLQGDLDALRDEYDIMLSYTRRGMADPDRITLRGQFLQRAYTLLALARWFHDKEDGGYFATVARATPPLPTTDEGAPSGADLVTLFHTFYVEAPWTKADHDRHGAWLTRPTTAPDKSVTVLSAITLAAYRSFDPQRLRLLIDLATAPNPQLRVRALVGMVLISLRYATLLPLFPDIEAQLQILADDKRFVRDLQALQLQLLLSQRTKQDMRKMEKDILPEIMRMAQKIKPHFGTDGTDAPDLAALDLNPEWDEKGQRSEVFRKMEELMKMQAKGADTFYATFRQISRSQAFFNDVANWFVPFSFAHPYFGSRQTALRELELAFKLRPMSSTEKYALCLTMQNLPDKTISSLNQSLKALSEANSEDEPDSTTPQSERDAFMLELRYYVQDLYRFFTLFVSRNERDNPFQLDLNLTLDAHFRTALSQPEPLRAFGNFCFAEKSWREAYSFFSSIPEVERDAEVYEKMGYCLQQTGNTSEAVECYERANLIHPDSAWTLRQLSRLYVRLGQYNQALEALHDLEKLNPDDIDTLLRLGECLIALDRPEQAFEKLHKADYLKPDGRALRALAWCSLLTGQYEQANKYYTKIMGSQPTAEDCLNAGHAAWLAGQPSEALVFYQQCLRLQKKDYAAPDFFNADADVLRKAGIKPDDLLIMRDALNSL